ncbi:YceI family protein [Leifsonia sp. NPDC058230]|uniref:YceI family protein n=1 Tax=Leifsonia sp. NPDC058230 TaxID=3346391 RepID=UPI0036DE0F46
MSPVRTSSKIWIGVIAGVVVVGAVAAIAGPYVYRDLVSGPPAAVPTVALTADPKAETTLDTADLSGTWKVGADSFAGYRLKEVLNGVDVTVTGRTSKVSGDLTVDGLTLTQAKVTVEVGSIATDEPARDAYFRSSALQTDKFPQATFTLTQPVTATGTPKPGDVQTLQATGELSLHGVTKPVTVELQVGLNGNAGQLSGSIPITFADFGVDAPDLGFVTVEKTGSVEFLLNLEK